MSNIETNSNKKEEKYSSTEIEEVESLLQDSLDLLEEEEKDLDTQPEEQATTEKIPEEDWVGSGVGPRFRTDSKGEEVLDSKSKEDIAHNLIEVELEDVSVQGDIEDDENRIDEPLKNKWRFEEHDSNAKEAIVKVSTKNNEAFFDIDKDALLSKYKALETKNESGELTHPLFQVKNKKNKKGEITGIKIKVNEDVALSLLLECMGYSLLHYAEDEETPYVEKPFLCKYPAMIFSELKESSFHELMMAFLECLHSILKSEWKAESSDLTINILSSLWGFKNNIPAYPSIWKKLKANVIKHDVLSYDKRFKKIQTKHYAIYPEDRVYRNKSPLNYMLKRNFIDIDLKRKHIENPNPHRFIYDFLLPMFQGDEESVRIVQRYLGIYILGHNLSQKMLIIRGDAGCGKSSVLQIFNYCAKDNTYEFDPTNLDSNFGKGNLLNSKAILNDEISPRVFSHKNSQELKVLVADGVSRYEQKNAKELIDIEKRPLPMIASTNFKQLIDPKEDVEAWLRRLLVLDATRVVARKSQPNYASKLWKLEAPDIFGWGLQGLSMFFEDNQCLEDKSLSLSHLDRKYEVVGMKTSLSDWVRVNIEYDKDLYDQRKGLYSIDAMEAFGEFSKNSAVLSSERTFQAEFKRVINLIFKDPEGNSMYSQNLIPNKDQWGQKGRGRVGFRGLKLKKNKWH